MKHILTLFDLTRDELHEVLATAADLKRKCGQGRRDALFPGRVLALLFEKPSLRTRVSFETAMSHLGGHTMYLGSDVGWGKREPIEDFARVLGGYVDVIACRAYQHTQVEYLAKHSPAPVINALTDQAHPCQALADLFTLQECRGSLEGLKLAYIGDANNVANSLALACARLGVTFAIASPPGYTLSKDWVQRIRAAEPKACIECHAQPADAVRHADCVYTDVWISMGQEQEKEQRLQVFQNFQVNSNLMKQAPDAVFMHCLPAHRGLEVAAEVMDGPQSVVYQQAENRMHVQKSLLAHLL